MWRKREVLTEFRQDSGHLALGFCGHLSVNLTISMFNKTEYRIQCTVLVHRLTPKVLKRISLFRNNAHFVGFIFHDGHWHDGLDLVLCANRDCSRSYQLGGFAAESLELGRNYGTQHAITIADRHLFKG